MSGSEDKSTEIDSVLNLLRVMDSFTGNEEGYEAEMLLAPVRRLDMLRFTMASLAAQSSILSALDELAKAHTSMEPHLINAHKMMSEMARAAAKSTGIEALDQIVPPTGTNGEV